MSLDEEPCGPWNTPELGDRGGLGRPPPPRTSVAPTSDADVDAEGDAEMSETMTSSPMSMSSSEMLAQGRALEARFEELIKMGGVGDGGGAEAVGLEFGSEARDFARFGMVL